MLSLASADGGKFNLNERFGESFLQIYLAKGW